MGNATSNTVLELQIGWWLQLTADRQMQSLQHTLQWLGPKALRGGVAIYPFPVGIWDDRLDDDNARSLRRWLSHFRAAPRRTDNGVVLLVNSVHIFVLWLSNTGIGPMASATLFDPDTTSMDVSSSLWPTLADITRRLGLSPTSWSTDRNVTQWELLAALQQRYSFNTRGICGLVSVLFIMALSDPEIQKPNTRRQDLVMHHLFSLCIGDIDFCVGTLIKVLVVIASTARTPGPVVSLHKHQNNIARCSDLVKQTIANSRLWTADGQRTDIELLLTYVFVRHVPTAMTYEGLLRCPMGVDSIYIPAANVDVSIPQELQDLLLRNVPQDAQTKPLLLTCSVHQL